MGNHKNRRSQTAKPVYTGRNEKFSEAMMELGRSNATAPQRNKAKYNRKEKYRGRDW